MYDVDGGWWQLVPTLWSRHSHVDLVECFANVENIKHVKTRFNVDGSEIEATSYWRRCLVDWHVCHIHYVVSSRRAMNTTHSRSM